MINKIFESIKKFFNEVLKDIKKINFSSFFTDTRKLFILFFVVIAIVILFTSMNITNLLQGLLMGAVLFFMFLWRK